MKFDDFRDDLIKRSLESYNVKINYYNKCWESIPKYVPFSIRWMIALYMSFTEKPFKINDFKGLFEFKVK